MELGWNGELVAVWVQAITNVVVLVIIYWQLRQMNLQMTQNEEQAKFQRSWEFINFYQDELREEDRVLDAQLEDYSVEKLQSDQNFTRHLYDHYFKPRLRVFRLLNQMVSFQQVDERLLFRYLEEDFNRFLEIGYAGVGKEAFNKNLAPRLDLLICTWGKQGIIS